MPARSSQRRRAEPEFWRGRDMADDLFCADGFISPLAVDALVAHALDEDLGRAGDVTSVATVPSGTRARALVAVRKAGVVAGLPLVAAAFRRLAPDIKIVAIARDGDKVGASTVMTIDGDARAILAAERVALNFIGRCDGDGHLCRPGRTYEGADLLHAQDDSRPPRDRKICRSMRRRVQSSVRSGRRGPDQGQPHRRRRWRDGGVAARQSLRRSPGEDRNRSRHA